MLFADIIIDISHEAIDRSFQYIVGEPFSSKIKEGSLVYVPFGRGKALKKGYCIGLSHEPKIEIEKLKYIDSVEEADISIEGQLISLAMWMARTYGSTMAAALRTVLPATKRTQLKQKMTVSLTMEKDDAIKYLEELKGRQRHCLSKERLLSELINEESLPWDVITGKLNIASSVIRDLEKRGILRVEEIETHFIPKTYESNEDKIESLNEEQQLALDTFVSDQNAGISKTYLLHGVTGSGKTEVYIRMIGEVLSRGKSAIVLIPEIALTYQTLMRFYHTFGDKVSVINSRLSAGEKYDIIKSAREGRIRIIIGPRSALFAPFKDLGLIIMDEEHESSYKSEKSPRYHARETAIERARLSGASVVLGSATPSIESFYKAQNAEYKLLKLTKRAKAKALAPCEIIDLRAELKSGNRSILSKRLYTLMEENLQNNRQIMLFINRRGMLASVSCRACGEVIKCPHCDVSLSLHRDGKLYCHYCGYNTPAPKVCPKCNSHHIGGFKAGTEKIETLVQEAFPQARILRMDADSTRGKDGHEKILSAFANHEADILIGTQMIVKGHDFSNVSLVGILAADLSLNVNDFRSSERTFDLITQAAGRAGRDEIPGHVIIQTYKPESYAVTFAAAQDYEGFYKQEIAYRQLMNYPPASHILLIMINSKKEEEVCNLLSKMEKAIEAAYPDIWMSHNARPAIARINDIHRRMIYIKHESINAIEKVRSIAESIAEENKDKSGTNVSVYFDLDPMGFY